MIHAVKFLLLPLLLLFFPKKHLVYRRKATARRTNDFVEGPGIPRLFDRLEVLLVVEPRNQSVHRIPDRNQEMVFGACLVEVPVEVDQAVVVVVGVALGIGDAGQGAHVLLERRLFVVVGVLEEGSLGEGWRWLSVLVEGLVVVQIVVVVLAVAGCVVDHIPEGRSSRLANVDECHQGFIFGLQIVQGACCCAAATM